MPVWLIGEKGKIVSIPKSSVQGKPGSTLACTTCGRDDQIAVVNGRRSCGCNPIIRSYIESA